LVNVNILRSVGIQVYIHFSFKTLVPNHYVKNWVRTKLKSFSNPNHSKTLGIECWRFMERDQRHSFKKIIENIPSNPSSSSFNFVLCVIFSQNFFLHHFLLIFCLNKHRIFYFFIIINIDVQNRLHASRLISWTLKLTTIKVFSDLKKTRTDSRSNQLSYPSSLSYFDLFIRLRACMSSSPARHVAMS